MLRASPVLSMLLQTVKFIAKKSKGANLAQEIGFSAPNLCSLLPKAATQFCTSKKECNKLDLIQISISHWSVIMIGPGGLQLVVPQVYAIAVTVLLVGLPKKNSST